MPDNIKNFINKWTGRGNEKQETQQFWNDIIYDILLAPKDTLIEYEKPVKINGQTKFIDAYLPATKVLIEQKSLGIKLMKAEPQSDGMKLTPYEQGRRYGGYLPYDEQPRWIIDSNFEEIRVHDMKKPGDPPEIIKLSDMEKDYTRLRFLINTEDEHIQKEFEVSVRAGEIVGVLYDKLLEQYDDPDEHALQSLNRLCVRIVFCLYSEDAGLFGNNTHAFHDYMAQFRNPSQFRRELKELFTVLNQPPEERDKYLEPELKAFPYVNGGLFADDNLQMPYFTDEIVDIILEKASADFDWSDISPTIFGAIFESTLNPETRRSGGMHYTSIENIHKVIDPLFLDDLKSELSEIKADPIDRTRTRKLKDFQTKLASLRWLDPAAGSGNFLTETYLCIRRLENEVISDLHKGQIMMAFDETPNPIKVSINQFYGIEINDFACATAQTAMWIAEAKMMKETEAIVQQDLDFFPLTNNANIHEGNALRMDWNDVVPASELNYIMGNPPFVGQRYISREQHEDIIYVLDGWDNSGKVDYVVGWYRKAIDYIVGTKIRCALVSTNSITQGEQVAYIWKPLFEAGLIISFAYHTFIWDSEANQKAHVHCVIIGFECFDRPDKTIYYDGRSYRAKHINGYLIDSDDVFVERRKNALCDVPQMLTGNRQADGGFLTLSKDEMEELIAREPNSKKYIRRMLGSVEFINNKDLFCLWLVGVTPSELKSMPNVVERVRLCREHRLAGKPDRRRLADTPTLFREQINPDTAIIIPTVSSERRRYVPMGFIDKSIIVNANAQVISDASMYHLGVLTSNVHMAWMRAVAGRLEMRYRYSKDIVYNNFPWPEPTDAQRSKIEQTAQGILDARALYPESSLADLYDELTMPPELRKAHRDNDRAVMAAYGFDIKMTEQECVAALMKLYQELVEQ